MCASCTVVGEIASAAWNAENELVNQLRAYHHCNTYHHPKLITQFLHDEDPIEMFALSSSNAQVSTLIFCTIYYFVTGNAFFQILRLRNHWASKLIVWSRPRRSLLSCDLKGGLAFTCAAVQLDRRQPFPHCGGPSRRFEQRWPLGEVLNSVSDDTGPRPLCVSSFMWKETGEREPRQQPNRGDQKRFLKAALKPAEIPLRNREDFKHVNHRGERKTGVLRCRRPHTASNAHLKAWWDYETLWLCKWNSDTGCGHSSVFLGITLSLAVTSCVLLGPPKHRVA